MGKQPFLYIQVQLPSETKKCKLLPELLSTPILCVGVGSIGSDEAPCVKSRGNKNRLYFILHVKI